MMKLFGRKQEKQGLDNSIVSSDKNSLTNKHRSRTVRLAVIAGLVMLAIVAVIVYAYFGKKYHKPAVTKTNVGIKVISTSDLDKVKAQAFAVKNDGKDDAETQKTIDESLGKTTDPKQQAELYNLKAASSYSVHQYNQVREYAQKAEGLAPSADSARYLAMSAERLYDRGTALKYYKILVERLSALPDSDTSKAPNLQQAQAKVKELEG